MLLLFLANFDTHQLVIIGQVLECSQMPYPLPLKLSFTTDFYIISYSCKHKIASYIFFLFNVLSLIKK